MIVVATFFIGEARTVDWLINILIVVGLGLVGLGLYLVFGPPAVIGLAGGCCIAAAWVLEMRRPRT